MNLMGDCTLEKRGLIYFQIIIPSPFLLDFALVGLSARDN